MSAYRAGFLDAALACGAVLTGKPDGSEAITVVFTIEAWRAFDLAQQQAQQQAHARQLELESPTAAQPVAGELPPLPELASKWFGFPATGTDYFTKPQMIKAMRDVQFSQPVQQPAAVVGQEAVCETGMPMRKMHRWYRRVAPGTLLYEAAHPANGAQAGDAVLSDDDIKAVAINYAAHVAADIYDVTKYDCAEDFFNCVRAILAAAKKGT